LDFLGGIQPFQWVARPFGTENPLLFHRLCDSSQTTLWHAKHEDEASIDSEVQQYIVQIAQPYVFSEALDTEPRR
jgi:hypothetical protein